MNTQFDEIGQIIAIGALFLIGIGILLRNSTDFKTIFSELMEFKLPAVLLAPVFIAMLYAMGILIQSISKNAVADRAPSSPIPSFILPSDKDSRVKSFDSLYNLKATVKEKRKLDNVFCQLFTECVCVDSCCVVNKKATDYESIAKNQFFFYAKNKIFNELRFYPELKSIESRLFFATSLTFIAFYLSIILSILIFYYKVTPYLKTEIQKKIIQKNENNLNRESNFNKKQSQANIDDAKVKIQEYQTQIDKNKANFFENYKYEFVCLTILILLTIASSISYQSLQNSFNFRIFGYYVTSIS